MIKELELESKSCDNCLCWLKHCNAECCRGFYLDIPDSGERLSGRIFFITVPLTYDLKNYYRLHGMVFKNDKISGVIDQYEIISDKRIFLNKRCSYLNEDNLCMQHNTNLQPQICKDLKGAVLTPNCLFKYKKGETNEQEKQDQISKQ